MQTNNIAVIGGGAAGLTAAISAAMHGADVTIYEGGERCGKKILMTGNGRCNLTNTNAAPEHYHGGNVSFMNDTISAFWVDETLEFFADMGLITKEEEDGRVYPYVNQAAAVLDILRLRLDALGVKTVTAFEVQSVRKSKDGFVITSYDKKQAKAGKVIIATGGKAAPQTGSKGGGYDILKSLGHTITKTRPSLVQIKTEPDIVRKLKGIKADAKVSIDGHSEKGEVLFTDYGLSGIAVFSITAYLTNQKTISLDLMSGISEDTLYEMLCMRAAQNPNITFENFLVGMVNKRIGQVILKQIGIEPLSRRAATLTDSDIKKLARTIKNWQFKIEGTMSWNNAQVTKGGALTTEFNPKTMESRLESGVYAAGEVLDIDGDCGGYNLQWAWSSGYIAGKSAAGK